MGRRLMVISHWGKAVYLFRWPNLSRELQINPYCAFVFI